MNDKEFFYRVLGLAEPWLVEEVKLDLGGKKVEVRVAVKPGTKWGEDGKLLPIAGCEERNWRHLKEIAYLGMDEKSFRKGHRYGSLVNDLKEGVVLEVVEERTTEAAVGALNTLPPEVLRNVKAVAIDIVGQPRVENFQGLAPPQPLHRVLEPAVRDKCPTLLRPVVQARRTQQNRACR